MSKEITSRPSKNLPLGWSKDEDARSQVIRCLWKQGPDDIEPLNPYVYLIIDSAKDERIYPALVSFAQDYEIASLYQGRAAEEFAIVAPYLICLGTDLRLFDWLWQEGWGKGWGIFAQTLTVFETVRDHFRRLTMVRLESGETLLFRFYDPLVLPAFLATCNAAQLSQMFGPVSSYLVECRDQSALQTFLANCEP